jgi:hypothetical protein
MKLSNQHRYVQRVLDLYRDTPGTSGRVRPADRRLANRAPANHPVLALLSAPHPRAARPTVARWLPRLPLLETRSLPAESRHAG